MVNHKRVARLMREDNLLAVQPRAWVVTTDSEPRAGGLPESGCAHEVNRDQSVMGGRHHLYPAARRVRLPGRGAGRLVAQGGGLGAGAHPGGAAGGGRAGAGHRATAAAARPGAPLRSRRAICFRGVCRALLGSHGIVAQHEPARQPLRQRHLRELHAAPSSGKRSTPTPTAIWTICALTSRSSSSGITIASGCTRRWATGRRRSSNRLPHNPASGLGGSQHEFFQAWGNLSMG